MDVLDVFNLAGDLRIIAVVVVAVIAAVGGCYVICVKEVLEDRRRRKRMGL